MLCPSASHELRHVSHNFDGHDTALPYSCPHTVENSTTLSERRTQISSALLLFPSRNHRHFRAQRQRPITVAHHVARLGREDELPVRKCLTITFQSSSWGPLCLIVFASRRNGFGILVRRPMAPWAACRKFSNSRHPRPLIQCGQINERERQCLGEQTFG